MRKKIIPKCECGTEFKTHRGYLNHQRKINREMLKA